LYSPFRLAAKYIRYYFTASNGKGHGIHSPFVFDFITKVLNDKRAYAAYGKIENLRRQLLQDQRLLQINDFGAGSVAGNKKQRSIASIASNAAKPKKLGQLLYRFVQYYRPSTIIELGTSLGLSAAYLAIGNPAAGVTTCEGAGSIAAEAKENFSSLGIPNIEIRQGNFDDTLPALLKNSRPVDLAFIDGNHRKEPTTRYFEQLLQKTSRNGVIILDDIHWSEEMEAAWEQVKSHPAAMLTIDLFFIGLVFFSPDFKVKQHFIIRF
jgi:predicted O-methyltransferase YrrM